MKRIPMFTIAVALLCATPAFAQSGQVDKQGAGQSKGPGKSERNPFDDQMKLLTEKMGLTVDQQAKIRPIMQELHEATEKIKQDKKLTRDEQLAVVRPKRQEAGQKIRTFLTDDQKQKLAEYLKGPHRELHEGLSGNTPPAQEPPRL